MTGAYCNYRGRIMTNPKYLTNQPVFTFADFALAPYHMSAFAMHASGSINPSGKPNKIHLLDADDYG
jgi:L-fucose isomerase-like protein